MKYLYQYMARIIEQIVGLMSSFWGWMLIILGQLFMIEGVRAGLIGLGVVFMLDFITGLRASWIEHRRKKKTGQMAPYFLQSDKIRKSILKATSYFIFVGMSWLMWYLFFDGTMNLPMSTKDVNIITIAFGICITIECWSVLENLKRMGFDFLGRIGKAFKGFWTGYRDVNGES